MKVELTDYVMFPGEMKKPGAVIEVSDEMGKDLVKRKKATKKKSKK